MAARKGAPKSDLVSLQILQDGVFIAEDVRKDKGDKCHVDPETAKVLVDNGHAKPV